MDNVFYSSKEGKTFISSVKDKLFTFLSTTGHPPLINVIGVHERKGKPENMTGY